MFRSKSDHKATLFRKSSRVEDNPAQAEEQVVTYKKTHQPLFARRKQELPNINSPFLKKTVKGLFAEPEEEPISPMRQHYDFRRREATNSKMNLVDRDQLVKMEQIFNNQEVLNNLRYDSDMPTF